MTDVLAAPAAVDSGQPVLLGLPELDDRVITRARLERKLRASDDSVLTVVQAPMGSGKTLGVAGWAAGHDAVTRVLWLDAGRLDAGRGADDREVFWSRVRSGLIDLGIGRIAPVPGTITEAPWSCWFAALAEALDDDGGRWLFVLDDYPSGPAGPLGRQIAALLARTTALRLVITCTGTPAIDLARLGAGVRYAHIGVRSLQMDEHEVAEVLTRAGVTTDPAMIATVTTHTDGWALGVDLVARTLAVSDGDQAFGDFNGVLDEVIEAEVLAQLPAACRELIVRTSVVEEVSIGLGRAIMGEDVTWARAWIDDAQGFVELSRDGSWRCHPLLRRCARRRLDHDWPSLSRAARRTASRWNVDHGNRSAGLALAAELGDWTWASRSLVRSLAVPTILLGAADQATADIAGRALATTEPLIVAAAAVAAGEPQTAETALAQIGDESVGANPDSKAYRLTEAIIKMTIARARTDADDGLHWVHECRRLLAELSAQQPHVAAPELAGMLAAHEGAFLMGKGDLAGAVVALEPVDPAGPWCPAEAVATTECIGLLAWLEAVRGNLTAANRHAADVLTSRPADGDEVGVGFAQLAAAWVHVERGELDQARQRLDHMTSPGTRTRDPWLVSAQRLANARVAILRGEPDAARRLLVDIQRTTPAATAGWLADRCIVAVAEAQLAAGEAQQALAVLTPEPRYARTEARVLAARARHAIGDRRGARALLAAVGDSISDAPLPVAVQLWSLEAQLASEAGEGERVHSLVGRALQSAQREMLRSALTSMSPWIGGYVNRHPDLSREYRTFLMSMTRHVPRPPAAEQSEFPTAALLEPLTERELQVLERMALFLTTEEIAGDLYVSANTVKTHVKSLFLKLSVNRRADAVRRGWGLGLC